MINKWYQWLDSEPGSVILDGGLGFILKERGNDLRDSRLWSGKLLLTNPNELKEVAKEWLACGADIISTATYQVNTKLLQDEFNLSPDEANKTWRLSWTLLDDARQDFWKQLPEKQKQSRRYPVIAVSCGPYSAVLPNVSEYSGKYHGVTTADIRDFHLDRLRSLRAVVLETCTNSDPPNIVCFETIGNTAEAVIIAQIMGAEEFYHIPYWISFQCRDALHISCRDLLSEAVKTTLVHCAKSNLVGIGSFAQLLPIFLLTIHGFIEVLLSALRASLQILIPRKTPEVEITERTTTSLRRASTSATDKELALPENIQDSLIH
ncbi:unnamed protein product [Agarophyton chilense]